MFDQVELAGRAYCRPTPPDAARRGSGSADTTQPCRPTNRKVRRRRLTFLATAEAGEWKAQWGRGQCVQAARQVLEIGGMRHSPAAKRAPSRHACMHASPEGHSITLLQTASRGSAHSARCHFRLLEHERSCDVIGPLLPSRTRTASRLPLPRQRKRKQRILKRLHTCPHPHPLPPTLPTTLSPATLSSDRVPIHCF